MMSDQHIREPEQLRLENHRLKDRIEQLEAGFAWLKEFVDAQAEDAGLWAEAEYASEAYIQHGLRGCHAAIEIKALAALESDDE